MWTDLPSQVTEALERLNSHGHQGFLVGGCVRDILRGVKPTDYDLTTSATPEEVKALFSDQNVVETGIRHGTVTVFSNHLPLEITTFRTESAYSDGRHPDGVTFATTLEEDLSRRDFTVCAMAWSPRTGLVDLYGGREDLEKGIIRCVGEPSRRFAEDALRILRGARFASTLDFTVEEATGAAMLEGIPLLAHISMERIASEFTKLLCGKGAKRILSEYRELIAFFLPEIRPAFDFDQRSPHHLYDVYTHTLQVVEAMPADPTLRFAAFFHDLGKPRTAEGGRFPGHPGVSAELAEEAMNRLRMEKKLIRRVTALIREHDTLLRKWDTPRVLRLLSRITPELALPLLTLMEGDAAAKANPEVYLSAAKERRAAVEAVLESSPCLSVSSLAIGGKELLELGIPAGEEVGKTLQLLLEGVFDGKWQNTREDLISALKNQHTLC
ncbi:MAG: HD domain-containing protein [Clostridia bacterium]|nr:HD domain-containing protein [Clostridia bacterium]